MQRTKYEIFEENRDLKKENLALKQTISELKHNITCHKCGNIMCWDCDYDLNDYDEEKEGIVSFWHCLDCNISYEITEVFNEGEDE